MNINNNMKNKIIRLLMSNNNSLGTRIQRRKRSKRSTVNFQKSTKTSTFGPGRYTLMVTKLFTGRLDVQQEINVFNDILATNPELGRINNDFKYFLCEEIFVTFPARNLSTEGNMTPAYLMLNYDGTITENVRLQDNVKVIPPFLSNDKTFKYKLPRLNVYGGILNGWFKLENLSSFADLVFQLYAPSNTTNWYIRFDIRMKFRGPTNVSAKQVVDFNERKQQSNNAQEVELSVVEKMPKKHEQATSTSEKTPASAYGLTGNSNVSYKNLTGEICKSLPPNEFKEENQCGFMLVPTTDLNNVATGSG